MKATLENAKTEGEVLGSILVSDVAIERVVEVGLKVEDLYSDRHRLILSAALRLRQRGEPVDQLTVEAELERAGELDAAGGANVLDQLAAQVASPGNVAVHARRLQELSRQRRVRTLLEESQRILDTGATLNGSVPVLVEALLEVQVDRRAGVELLDFDGLSKLTPPSWLVRGHVVERGFNVLYGAPNAGKSFVALDWSLSIATGRPWLDCPVSQGPVVYIAAEGAHGLRNRVEAWRSFNGVDKLDRFWVWPAAVNLYVGDTGALESHLNRLPEEPVLLVVDTLARSFAGGHENETDAMTAFVDHVDQLRRRYDAAALIVHHPKKGTDELRGNGALEGAADCVRLLKVDGSTRRLVDRKTKDWRHSDEVGMALETFESSAILRPRTVQEASGQLERDAQDLLATVRATFRTVWASTADVRQVSDLGRTRFYEALRWLVDAEKLEVRQAGAQRKEYRVLEAEATVRDRSQPCAETSANRPSVTASLKEADGGQAPDKEVEA
jgi:hypothetical protein